MKTEIHVLKALLKSILLVVVITSTNLTHAVPLFSGTASGEWTNVVSTAPGDVYSINNNDIGSIATFNWGAPATTTFDNQFTFDGVGSDGDPEWSAFAEQTFLIGDFSYRNGSTFNSTGIDGVGLDVALDITSPLGVIDTFLFSYDITNTPNNTGDPVLDGDIVTVASALSPTFFTYDSVNYTLELLGFSFDGGTTIASDFSSPEGASTAAGLYARITTATVPAPMVLGLLSLGLVGVGAATKLRNKKH